MDICILSKAYAKKKNAFSFYPRNMAISLDIENAQATYDRMKISNTDGSVSYGVMNVNGRMVSAVSIHNESDGTTFTFERNTGIGTSSSSVVVEREVNAITGEITGEFIARQPIIRIPIPSSADWDFTGSRDRTVREIERQRRARNNEPLKKLKNIDVVEPDRYWVSTLITKFGLWCAFKKNKLVGIMRRMYYAFMSK